MKAKQLLLIPCKFYLVVLIALTSIFSANHAMAQIDYYYGLNKSGFRISAGVGATKLQTHFSDNPIKVAYIGNLDYDFNLYLSVGLEGQYGTLQGIDAVHHLYYYSSTDKYFSGTANVRVALGEFDDFSSDNAFKDAVKQLYIGVGVGAIKTNNDLKPNASTESTIYGSAVPKGKYLLIPFNLGTNINLPGVLGNDKLAINPNFQFNYVNSLFLDGFQSTQTSTLKGLYSILSVKLKYKF